MQSAEAIAHPAVAWLDGQRDRMIGLLAALVNSDSSSRDKLGVDATGDVLRRFFAEAGIAVETTPQAVFGDVLRATVPRPATADTRPIILIGSSRHGVPEG